MATTQGINLRQFEASFLSAHNKYRKLHGSPPLRLSRNLCSSAQRWADYILSIRVLQHSNWQGLGENIYTKSSSVPIDLSGNEGVDCWYGEVQKYNYSRPGFSFSTGHFTQVVWKDSKEVGYGVATDGKRVYYLVAQYSPAGNASSYFQSNVLPAGSR
ncbi:Golgi-associated plant pathogenesis-related protein 1-like [Rana temporaria]|uniref:Golgi-associated plant pathogenesis-related protein 1-like n=1 Tax=Rana temporaria TaxID=8407 RepID=UPI001AAD75EA|nr:Golgi-associated plant pathogenesis-related protein 1-like [Rana temporaria]